jgi:hypothetical protein
MHGSALWPPGAPAAYSKDEGAVRTADRRPYGRFRRSAALGEPSSSSAQRAPGRSRSKPVEGAYKCAPIRAQALRQ